MCGAASPRLLRCGLVNHRNAPLEATVRFPRCTAEVQPDPATLTRADFAAAETVSLGAEAWTNIARDHHCRAVWLTVGSEFEQRKHQRLEIRDSHL